MNKRKSYLLEDTFHRSGKDERCTGQSLHNRKHRCSSRKMFWGAKFPSTNLLSRASEKIIKIFFWRSHKIIFWRKKVNFRRFQSVSLIYHLITQTEQRCQRICAQTFRDFARILDKSKLLGVPLLPLHLQLLHRWH